MIDRIVIISPCRNEEKFIRKTLESMVGQTRRPDRWIIVDDASTDSSAEIVAEYCKKHRWIELVQRKREGGRQHGPGVVSAFNYGYALIGDDDYKFLVKMDCDIEFGPDCMEKTLRHFEDEKVGMASGKTILKIGDRLVAERYKHYHVSGAFKCYRKECFEDVGGLKLVYGWDILDESDARRHGWKTVSDDSIPLIHHRLQGSSFGKIRGRVLWGWGAYAIGSHPIFAIGRAIYRMAELPWIICGLAVMWGYISAHFKSTIKRNTDKESIRFLRREQMYRLFHGNRIPMDKA